MAEIEQSTPSATGDHANNDGQQAAENTSQEASQGQGAEHGSQVDSQAQGASSAGTQSRSEMNFTRAQERVLERKIQKLLDKAIQPLAQRLNQPQSPAAPTQSEQQKVEIDYNDLPGSINRLVQLAAQQHLGKFEKEKLQGLDSQLDQKLSVREARTFLLTQPEINGDADKMEEIQEIISNDRILSLALDSDPVAVVKEAVSRWKKGRTNPNAPQKDTLTTVTGGTVDRGGKKDVSVQELRKLQDIIMSNAPTSEKEAAYKRIDELSKVA